MRLSPVHNNSSFRLAVGFATLFVVAFLGIGALALHFTIGALESRMDALVAQTSAVIEASFGSGDVNDLRETVHAYAVAAPSHDRVFVLADATGQKLAGNIDLVPKSQGWRNASAGDLGVAGSDRFRLLTAAVGPYFLTVGMSDKDTAFLIKVAEIAFATTSLLVFAFAAGGGIIVGYRTQRRLDRITETLESVANGALAARVPIGRGQDEFDRLGRNVNRALVRLEKLVEGVRQVGNDIAHELRSPLNRLSLLLDQAKAQAKGGGNLDQALWEAEQECFRVSEIFDALLRISQLEAGARRAHFRHVDLGDTLSRLCDVYDEVARDAEHPFCYPVEWPAGLGIRGDSDLLIQLFANLIENAMRHTSAGTRIALGVHANASDVQVTVADSGGGIPPSERDKVFDRLYRLEPARTTPGSGLGLSLVRAIVEAHEGHIELNDNAPGLKVSVTFAKA